MVDDSTLESIATALDAQQREREAFTRVTGVRLDPHGRPLRRDDETTPSDDDMAE